MIEEKLTMPSTRKMDALRDHCRRFASNWDYYCLASDSFLAGFRLGKTDPGCSNDPTTYERAPGEHQLSVMSFTRWQNWLQKMTLREHLEKNLYFDIKDLRVHEAEDGTISFQGTAKKKETKFEIGNDNA